MSEKRKKTYHFHDEWEVEFFFTTVRGSCVCFICGATVAIAKRHKVERHFTTCHTSYHANYPPGSALRTEKARELKAALCKQQSFFTRPDKNSQKATEASFRATQFLMKKKKAFTDGEVVKEAMMIIAKTVLEDEKYGTDVLSSLSDVQLGATTMVRRVSAMSGNLTDQLDRDLARCRWFSIQCDESVDSSSTAQLMVFIRMVFDDFSTKEELLTLLPLKTTTRGVDIYNTVKEFLVEKKVPLEKLVSVTTDGAPAMIGRHTGFVAHCKADLEFPNFLQYHCIIHQQALCAKVICFEHVMTPVVKIINSIRSRAKQHRTFKVLLEELSAEYGDLLLHTEIRWLSRGRILQRFLSLLDEIKEFMQSRGEDTVLLEDTEWILDLAFLTDITGKLNSLNCELQGKGKTVADMISALYAFKAKMNLFSVHLQRKKVLHFPSVQMVLKDNASASEAFDKVAEKYSQVINRVGQEFENRFCDLDQLEPCVSFISNPFMNVDISCIAEQLSATFSLDAEQVEIEIVTLQNDLHLPWCSPPGCTKLLVPC
ncbi:general transcription factor II-I repeat domain-containing protein 2-like [Solea senegalensis]|uniref:General transcription factor II-I repeat domain-containing protein 2-like n=1 Tax=Solea senegalensis TaxID=28829 RepID=A0AAV6QHB5_SOLSE|nr:general transcription factor II-I repeat domain-containing protein 2-like [Solea senegalensis]